MKCAMSAALTTTVGKALEAEVNVQGVIEKNYSANDSFHPSGLGTSLNEPPRLVLAGPA